MIASCTWCGKGFYKQGKHYWCTTRACRVIQAKYAIAIQQPNDEIALFYVPLPKQVDFELKPVRYLLGGGAAGATKSHQARFGLYRRALVIPNFEALILRKTWGQLEKHHLRLMAREALEFRSLGIEVYFHKGDREMVFPNGSIIEGGHMDNDDLDNYLSRERDVIVGDEASTFNPKDLLELSTRARSAKPEVEAFTRQLWGMTDRRRYPDIPAGGAAFWVLSNPGGEASSMLQDMFINKTPNYDEYPQLRELDSEGKPNYQPSEWGFVKGDLEDNPYLPKDYERNLALSSSPERFKQLRWGNWDVTTGQFFSEFDSRIHVKDLGTPEGVRWFRSYDYGYVHYGCCHWWAILPDGRLYIRAEFKHQHLDIERIATAMHRITKELHIKKISYTVGDKYSMGSRKDDTSGITRGRLFASCGVPMIDTNHDRMMGWTRIRELLSLRSDGLPWLVMHPNCTYLIRSMSAATSDKHNLEDIDYTDDHALSSVRYGAMSQHAPHEDREVELPEGAMGHDLRALQNPTPDNPYAFH
ncbi:hypothetical protein LCGC14_0609890 [marine sediment metagenome]|uniref:Phage terminase large subunit N-terminal domain-containing protein n=1 Tax=marine sediment metagenome TaxID=412755 RepID=A0A0F9UGF8_9ZZZZ